MSCKKRIAAFHANPRMDSWSLAESPVKVWSIIVKKLTKQFQKGINRVAVGYRLDGKREATEAILNAQF